MASPLDSLDKIPIWQRILIFFLGAAILGALWFFLYYEEAVANHNTAKQALAKAQAELARVQKEKENFLERQRKLAELETELEKRMEVLPMTTAAVDNLMQTFQQKARAVGVTMESWSPSSEQKQDFYARLPIKVRATGSWAQVGEFFRKVSEIPRPVSIENVSMERIKVRDLPRGAPPPLVINFEAATYRFLTEAERAAAAGKTQRRRRRK